MLKAAFVAFAVAAFASSPVLASDKMPHKHGAPDMQQKGHDMKGHGMSGHGKKMEAHTGPVPHDLDIGTRRVTDHGMFTVDIASRLDPVAINKMHSWELRVRTKDGKPADGAKITIDGGMPRHGHGLPTAPRVTEALGDGTYLVEGMRFSMTGWWEVTFDIDDGRHRDSVTFNLILK